MHIKGDFYIFWLNFYYFYAQIFLKMIGYLFLGLILGGVLVYFFMKSSWVSRKIFQEVNENFIKKETEFLALEEQKKQLAELLETEKKQFFQQNELYQKNQNELVKITAERDLKQEQFEIQYQEMKNLEKNFHQLSEKNQEYYAQIAEFKAQNQALEQAMNEQKKVVEELQNQARLQFENIANKILEEKSQKFTSSNQENLQQILKPLGENIESFRKKVDEVYQNEARERFSLNNTIKMMMEQSNKISQEANNLATALKGQTKIQGDWGEMILERILENSGLSKDREYFIQPNIKNEEGANQRPDFIIKFPDNKQVIVDSKVSLNAYEKMSSTENLHEQEQFLNLHIRAIKNHIDTLAEKEYHKNVEGVDFTIMFVPIESAFLVAMQHESNLWNYAYKKNVIVLSPTNLIAYLKLISEVWKKYDQNKNSDEIARQAGDLYDKFVGFIEDLVKIGKKMNEAKSDYEEAMKKLSTGRGNIVRRIESLKDLGVKSKKNIPDSLIERSKNNELF